RPRVAVLVFPGTNSEVETVDACNDAGMDARAVLWSEAPASLREFAAYVLPGGFAYEDRVRAGAIAAKSPSVAVVAEEAQRGKLVLGLCNGAQVVAEAGLLGPVAIAHNLPAGHFQCRILDVELSAPPARCAITAALPAGTRMKMAMAHGEGRFTADPQAFDALDREGRVTFRYVGGAPNSALHNAAAVCNDAGNVLAIMPHPERVAWNYNLAFEEPRLRGLDPMRPSPTALLFAGLARALKD
ncbi:MAG TPA: phosphoribosylformylglycinamidine synthase subunit PurQ, partial [Candidatus Acidoferrales bacterium]|nr:phosphoribosylformylglycinamidine synthase subunit PurQ [Candidatus Acidoferrales bacterium]